MLERQYVQLQEKFNNNQNNNPPKVVTILNENPTNRSILINTPKKRGPNPAGIQTFKNIQQRAKKLRQQNPALGQKQAVAIAGEVYRQQNGTTRKPKPRNNKTKCKCNK